MSLKAIIKKDGVVKTSVELLGNAGTRELAYVVCFFLWCVW